MRNESRGKLRQKLEMEIFLLQSFLNQTFLINAPGHTLSLSETLKNKIKKGKKNNIGV